MSKNEITVSLDKTYDTDKILMIIPNYKELEFRNDAKSFNAVVAKKEKRYETNWARMEPFIVASGRLNISNMILPNIENVVRCHTDGIILKKPIANVKLGSDIGDLKFEGLGTCHIINSKDFKFNDKTMVEKKFGSDLKT